MKYARNNSFARFVPILLVIVITILAVAAVIAIGRALMGGGDANRQTQQSSVVDPGKESLLSSESGRAVRLTVRGPIVADEKFRSYQITATADERTMVTYEGYLDRQLAIKKHDNNARAYEEFVYALDKRKMMEGRALPEEKNDLRGICAPGKVYKFETLMNGEPIKTLWTSDCGGSKGSAAANVDEIVDMFQKQIPDGKKLASDVDLSQQDTLFKL